MSQSAIKHACFAGCQHATLRVACQLLFALREAEMLTSEGLVKARSVLKAEAEGWSVLISWRPEGASVLTS